MVPDTVPPSGEAGGILGLEEVLIRLEDALMGVAGTLQCYAELAFSVAEKQSAAAENLLFYEENLLMAEETVAGVAEAPVTATGEQKSPRTRSLSDQVLLKQLALIESVAHAAQRPECVAPLAAEEITAAFVATLLTDTQATQVKLARVVTLHGTKQGSTATEKSHHTDLLTQLTALGSAGLRKWGSGVEHKGDRDAYGIGQKLAVLSRPALESIVTGILQRIAADDLPGVTPAKIASLQTTYNAWKTAD